MIALHYHGRNSEHFFPKQDDGEWSRENGTWSEDVMVELINMDDPPAVKCCEIEGSDWFDCLRKYHEHMGWEPDPYLAETQ